MRILILLFIFAALIGNVKGQEDIIRLPGEVTKIDSTLFPPSPYNRVVSYSLNQEKYIKAHEAYLTTLTEFRNLSEMSDTAVMYSIIAKHDSIQPLLWKSSRLIFDNALNQFADSIGVLELNQIKKIKQIFSYPGYLVPDPKCRPVYRDALVFYSKSGEVVGSIEISFQCLKLYFHPSCSRRYINTDQWSMLEDFFKNELGHPMGYGK